MYFKRLFLFEGRFSLSTPQVLAESSQRISSELRAQWPQIDWKRIAAFRNVLVHDYLGLDLDRIWEVTQRDIPELKKIVEKILG